MAECPAVPILHYQPQLFVPPSQETRAGSPGPYSRAGMLCQHFPGPGGGGEGLVQDQQTWPRSENVPSPPHTPTPSRTTGRKNGKDSEMGSPSSILSLPVPCPGPRKTVYSGLVGLQSMGSQRVRRDSPGTRSRELLEGRDPHFLIAALPTPWVC